MDIVKSATLIMSLTLSGITILSDFSFACFGSPDKRTQVMEVLVVVRSLAAEERDSGLAMNHFTCIPSQEDFLVDGIGLFRTRL